jgi:hypothetical protein
MTTLSLCDAFMPQAAYTAAVEALMGIAACPPPQRDPFRQAVDRLAKSMVTSVMHVARARKDP